MATFNNGESLSSVRTKINDAIDKIDGNATISNNIDVSGTLTIDTINETTAAAGVTIDSVLLKDGGATFTSDVSFGDNDKAIFGAGSDLQIYHDGSNSYISDTAVGDLKLTSNGTNITFEKADGTDIFNVSTSGATTAYYNGNPKLATTSTGIDVTGTVTADGLTVDGDANLSGTAVNFDLDETDTTDLNTRFRQSAGQLFLQTANDAKSVGYNRFNINHSTGDISFYEDTGTTPKFFWDASAESLGIGTIPNTLLHLKTSGNTDTAQEINLGLDNGVASDPTAIEIKQLGGSTGDGVYSFKNYIGGALRSYFWTSRDNMSVGVRSTIATQDGSGTLRDRITMDVGETVINDGGLDQDFRVESDGNTHALFVDASIDAVGFGTNAPRSTSRVSINGNAVGAGQLQLMRTENTTSDPSYSAEGGHFDIYQRQDGATYRRFLDIAGVGDSTWGGTIRLLTNPDGTNTTQERVRWHTSSVVFNDVSNDYDFRVESDGNTHALFVDASQSTVGIGTSSTFQALNVNGNIAVGGAGNKGIIFGDNITSSVDQEWLLANNASASNAFNLYEYNSGTYVKTRFSIESGGDFKIQSQASGSVVINDDSENSDFRVESNNNANAFLIDAGNDLASFAVKTSLYDGSAGNSPSLIFGGETAAGPQKSIYLDTYYMVHQIHVNEGAKFRFTSGTVASFDDRHLIKNSEVVWNETSKDSDFRVESNNSDHMLFVDAGNDRIGVNNASPSSTVHIGRSGLSNTGLTIQSATTSALITLNGRMNNSGSTTTAIEFKDGSTATTEGSITVTSSGTTYNTTSDRRLKDNIATITDGTEKLMAMNPVTHTWINDPNADAVHGFIAQEMQEIVPEAVSGDPDSQDMMSMDYGRITPVLVAALQDAHKKIEALEERLAELEAN